MFSRHAPILSGFLFLGVLLVLSPPASARSRPLIITPIDNAARVQIPQSHPLLKHAVDLGPLNEGETLQRMILVLNMAPEQRHDAMALLDSQQTKGSPNYHRWLTPDQYGDQFGPAPEDVAQVSAWLQQQGLTVSGVAKSGMWIEFSGTAGLVNRAFHTQIRRYKVNGENHIANRTDISIPAALAPLVKGVPLHDRFSKPAFVRSTDLPAITNSAGVHAITPGDFAAIYDLAPLYKSNLNGSGQTIAILSKSDVNLSDVAQFQKIFGLPSNVPNLIDNGASPGVTPAGGYGVEASLDAEWAAAVAPGATIDVVASWDTYTTDGVLLSAMYVVDHNLAQIVNVSFTACEQNMGEAGNALWNGVWQQAAAQGMSVFVASGDAGAADCDSPGLSVLVQGPAAVNGLSSTPFNTSVGGTEFDEAVHSGKGTTFWNKTNGTNLASAIGYIPEMVWNDTCPGTSYCPPSTYIPFFSGGGGGVSTIYPTPAWQTLNVTGLEVLKNYGLPAQLDVTPRGIPDVSLAAAGLHDPFLFCFTDPFHPENPDCQLDQGAFGANTFQNAGGGTSFASPAFAGFMAIINQKMAALDPSPDGRQGLANYTLYSLAASEDFSSCNSSTRTNPSVASPAACTFNDITVGDNHAGSYAGLQLSYGAGPGYDLASGLGSVDALNLVNSWPSAKANFHGSQTTLSNTSSNPISINHGQSATFDVAVSKLSGDSTTQVPSGSISLIAQRGTGSVGVMAAPLASGDPAATGNFSTNNLPGGTYSLIANFPGDGHFAGSASNAIPVTVAPEATTTTLYGSATEPYGTQLIDYSAGVVGSTGNGHPSGVVTLTDGGTAFAQIKLNNEGVATFLSCNSPGGILTPAVSPLPCLTPGVHVVSATYGGDDSFSPSPTPPAATQTLTVTITKGAPYMQLSTTTKGPNTLDETYTLTTYLGSVSPAALSPTGTIVFSEGANVLGQASVVSTPGAAPQAAIHGTFSQGKHNITVAYSGDVLYASQTKTWEFDNGVPIGWSAQATSEAVSQGKTAIYNLTLSTTTGFTGEVPLTCVAGTDPFNPAPLPAGVQCTVSPTTATLDSTTTSVPIVVAVTTAAQSTQAHFPWGIMPFALAGVVGVGLRRKSGTRYFLLMAIALVAVCTMPSCGGGSSSMQNPPPPPPVNLTFVVWSTYPGPQPGYTDYNGVVLNLTINR